LRLMAWQGVRRIVALTADDAEKAIAAAADLASQVEAVKKLAPGQLEQATTALKVVRTICF
jgi:hypothetical protein